MVSVSRPSKARLLFLTMPPNRRMSYPALDNSRAAGTEQVMMKADLTCSFRSWAKANVVVPPSKIIVSPSWMYSKAALAIACFCGPCWRALSRKKLLKRLRLEKTAPPKVLSSRPSLAKSSKSFRIVTTLSAKRSANSPTLKMPVVSRSLSICSRRGFAVIAYLVFRSLTRTMKISIISHSDPRRIIFRHSAIDLFIDHRSFSCDFLKERETQINSPRLNFPNQAAAQPPRTIRAESIQDFVRVLTSSPGKLAYESTLSFQPRGTICAQRGSAKGRVEIHLVQGRQPASG